MKLARIDHIRCREYAACTFVWVRDNMTDEELEERVVAAQKEYLATIKDFGKRDKPAASPWAQPHWEEHRSRLVGDVLDEFKAMRDEAMIYAKSRSTALQDFDYFLKQQEGIEGFWDHEFEMHADVDWGHAHALKIEYGETDWPTFRLLKPTKTRAPNGTVMLIEDDEEWV